MYFLKLLSLIPLDFEIIRSKVIIFDFKTDPSEFLFWTLEALAMIRDPMRQQKTGNSETSQRKAGCPAMPGDSHPYLRIPNFSITARYRLASLTFK